MVEVKSSRLKKITKELYKKNLELLNANRTLTLLQDLYEIMMVVFTMEEVTQQFIDVITKTLELPSGMVAIEVPGEQLQIIATTQSEINKVALGLIKGSRSELKISLAKKENTLVEAFRAGKKRTTHDILEVWKPLVNEEKLRKIARKANIQSTLVYPIIFGEEKLGVFSISLTRDAQDMTVVERRSLRRVATFFGIAIDRIKISQRLRRSNKRLKEVSALKDEFVSLTSHELRTPLSAINGSLSTLLEGYAGKVSPKAKEFLDGAHNETNRLLRLVNNLLNISRLEAGRLKFNITEFDLISVIKESLESLKTQVEEKKLSLLFSAREKLMVKADQDKVREIVVNLVGNALKFTNKGRVAVNVSTQANMVLVAVEDTGRGILPEDQEKLFKKFERVNGVENKEKKGGTGLGLYICKNLVKGMGGEIWLKSLHGKGTTFFFTLPLI